MHQRLIVRLRIRNNRLKILTHSQYILQRKMHCLSNKVSRIRRVTEMHVYRNRKNRYGSIYQIRQTRKYIGYTERVLASLYTSIRSAKDRIALSVSSIFIVTCSVPSFLPLPPAMPCHSLIHNLYNSRFTFRFTLFDGPPY